MADDTQNTENERDDTQPSQTADGLCEQAEDCRAKAEEYLDKYRRSVAEFSNYRKRQEKERQQQALRLRMDVMTKVLPIVDDMDLALANMPSDITGIAWVEGMVLINRKLHNLLTEAQVTPMEAQGTPFDPYYHLALMKEPSDQYAEGLVSEELQKGYLIEDQVLRHAVVKVSEGPGPKS